MSLHARGPMFVAVLALAAAACTTGTPDGPATGIEGGSVTAYQTAPGTLDPAISGEINGFEIMQRVFDPLIDYDPVTLELLPSAAESWVIADNARSVTFQLREGATFHNGEPVNAEAFIRGISRAVSKELASEIAYHAADIVGSDEVQTVEDSIRGMRQGEDQYELIIRFNAPNPEFVIRTGHTLFSPVPQAAIDNPRAFGRNPIGNGPYRMKGPQTDEGVTIEKWDGYTGPRPGFLDEITWEFHPDVNTAYLEFEAGTIDATQVPNEQYAAAAEAYGEAFIDVPTADLNYLFANVKEPPTDEKAFRQAISLAIDREAINETVFAGTVNPATSLIPPSTAGHRPDSCEYCLFDAAAAKTKLEESGVDPSTSLEIIYNPGGDHDLWVNAIVEMLKTNLGLTDVTSVEGSDDFSREGYIGQIRRVKGLARLGWGQDYPSPGNWLYPLAHSESGDNLSGYSNREYDRLVQEAQETLDPQERIEKYQEAEDFILEEMALIPIYNGLAGYVYNEDKFATLQVDVQLGLPVWELVQLQEEAA